MGSSVLLGVWGVVQVCHWMRSPTVCSEIWRATWAIDSETTMSPFYCCAGSSERRGDRDPAKSHRWGMQRRTPLRGERGRVLSCLRLSASV